MFLIFSFTLYVGILFLYRFKPNVGNEGNQPQGQQGGAAYGAHGLEKIYPKSQLMIDMEIMEQLQLEHRQKVLIKQIMVRQDA